MPLETFKIKLQRMYKSQDTLPKLIEDEAVAEQKLDEYYVKLNILVDDKEADDKKFPIELAQMFDPVAEQSAVGRVLILGVAGVGKSTFLNHITYEWSKGNVFQDKFDSILKIRLKSLLDETLCRELSSYPKKDRLAVFVHRCIEQQQIEQSAKTNGALFTDITLEEIKALDKSRAVLLLDGYDEVEHCNQGTHMVREMLGRIFEYPNIVVTSRPNAVSSALETKFERKIENVGFGHEGVRHYVTQYFSMQAKHINGELAKISQELSESSQKMDLFSAYEAKKDSKSKDMLASLEAIDRDRDLDEGITDFQDYITAYHHRMSSALLALISRNTVLVEAMKTPINAAMICLVGTDSEILAGFTGDFNAGAIYQGVIVWLGKRFLTKFKKEEAGDINFSRALRLRELEVLKKVAHDKFTINKFIISGDELDQVASSLDNTLGIREVNKFGLLRAEKGKVGFDLEIKLYGKPLDSEVASGKLYLYVIDKQLCCRFIGRNGLEEIQINEGIDADRIAAIKNSIVKKKRQLSKEEEKFLADFISVKGYVLHKSFNGQQAYALEARDLIHKRHSFVHLSFYEYLTAMSLKEFLSADLKSGLSGHVKAEEKLRAIKAAEFIARNRNEPRYLMTLKFLAGLVTHAQDENSQILVSRFWEAMTCNVDGVLELGAERKVTLLMHLLSQAEIEGDYDPRIPNVDKIINFIDSVVLRDLLKWNEHIKTSGYLSARMQAELMKMLAGDFDGSIKTAAMLLSDSQKQADVVTKTKMAIAMASSLAIKLDKSTREGATLKVICDYLENETINWQIKKAARNGMIEIYQLRGVKINTDEAIQRNQILLRCLSDANVRIEVMKAIQSIVALSEEQIVVATKILLPTMSLLSHQHPDIARFAVEIISKVIAGANITLVTKKSIIERLMLFLKEEGTAAYYIVKTIGNITTESGIAGEAILEITKQLMPLLSREKFIGLCAIEEINKIAIGNNISPNTKLAIITQLLPWLNQKRENSIAGFVAEAIGKIAMENDISLTVKLAIVDQLRPSLSNRDTAEATAEAIEKIAVGFDMDAKQVVLAQLTLLLSQGYPIAHYAARAISEIAAGHNIPLDTKLSIITQLTPWLNQENNTSQCAARAISKIAAGNDSTGRLLIAIVAQLIPSLSQGGNASDSAVNVIDHAVAGNNVSIDIKITIVAQLMSSLSQRRTATSVARIISNIAAGTDMPLNTKFAVLAQLTLLLTQGDATACAAARAIDKIATGGDIAGEVAIATVEKLTPLLMAESFFAEPAAGAINKIATGSGITENVAIAIVEQLTPLLKYEKCASYLSDTMGEIAAKGNIAEEVAIAIVQHLTPLLKSNKHDARSATEAIGKIATGASITEKTVIAITEQLMQLLSQEDELSIYAAKAISNIVARGNISLRAILAILASCLLLSGTNRAAVRVIGNITAWVEIPLNTKIAVLAELTPLLNQEYSINHCEAVVAMGNIAAEADIPLSIKLAVLTKLTPLLNQATTAHAVVCAIDKIVTGCSITGEKAIEITAGLMPLLSGQDIYHASSMSDYIVIVIDKIAAGDGISLETKLAIITQLTQLFRQEGNTANYAVKAVGQIVVQMTIDYLVQALAPAGIAAQNAKIENIIIITLTEKLHALLIQESPISEINLVQVNETVTTTLMNMLMIIGKEIGTLDDHKQKLRDIAWKVLDKHVAVLSRLKLIAWVNENFDHLISLSSEAKRMMSDLCRLLLSDENIDADESEFIINCIQRLKLTMTIMRPKSSGDDLFFSILFEKNVYQLKGTHNVKYLTKITRAVLSDNVDMLAKQYDEHMPLFLNTNTGMRVAASDIGEVVSMVDQVQLDRHHWHVSLMHASDHKKSEPTRRFLLIERRDEFGYYEVHQFNCDDAMVIMDSRSFTRYPTMTAMDDLTFRTIIFGEMRYDVTLGYKPRRYATTIKLEFEQGLALMASITQAIGKITLPDAMVSITVVKPFVFFPWPACVEHAQEYKKIQLFALSEQSDHHEIQRYAESARRDSFQIQATASLEDLNQLKLKLNNINFNTLTNILDREQYSQQQQAVLEGLDAYQYSFYQTLVLQLNAMYIATSSINSQLIASNGSNQAVAGKIGGFLQSISSHIPLIGVGVQMIGAIMVQVDQNDQADAMAKYATMMPNSADMASLAGEIALKLAPHAQALLIPEEGFSGKFGEAMDKLSQAVASCETSAQIVSALKKLNPNDMLESLDVVSIAANCISGLKSRIQDVNEAAKQDAAAKVSRSKTDDVKKYAERLLFGVEKSAEDTNISDGQEQANAIAAFIIKQILTGEITAGESRIVKEQIQTIVRVICHTFITPPVAEVNEAIDSNPITRVKKQKKVYPESDDNEKQALSSQGEVEVKSSSGCIVSCVKEIIYNNPLLNHRELLSYAAKNGGAIIINNIIQLGETASVAAVILAAIEEHGVAHVFHVLFSPVHEIFSNSNHSILFFSKIEGKNKSYDPAPLDFLAVSTS